MNKESAVWMRGCSWMVLVVAGSWALSCQSGPQTRPRVSYRVSAEENFTKGKKAYEKEDYQEAVEFLTFVKTKFPFSSYAAEADLLLADCDFGRSKFIEAAEGYTNFVKMHPKHPKVPYAVYRIGLCYYNRIPDDWWFMPPAYELDQEETDRAIRELERYLRQYPQDENVADAKKSLDKCKQRIADRARYVMGFYYKRNHPRGVVWRAEEILSKYSGLGFDEEALFRKGQALADLGEVAKARTSLEQLLQQYPRGDYASSAQKILDKLPTSPNAPAADAGSASK